MNIFILITLSHSAPLLMILMIFMTGVPNEKDLKGQSCQVYSFSVHFYFLSRLERIGGGHFGEINYDCKPEW